MRDYRFRNVVYEELMRAGGASLASGFSLQDDILIPYVVAMGTEEQKQRWLPDMCAGRSIMAVAMTEPRTGSDLTGIRPTAPEAPPGWVVNGSQTFLTTGTQSTRILFVAQPHPSRPPPLRRFLKGFSLT